MAAKKQTKVQAAIDAMEGLSAQPAASDGQLVQVSKLAQAQFDATLEVAKIEDSLKVAKAKLFNIATIDLPTAMKAAGIGNFTTSEGLEVKVSSDVKVGIPEAKREAAYQWLVDNKFDGIIKSDMELIFDKDELKKAKKLADELEKKGYTVTLNQAIHAQTLKAFVKERMADTDSDIVFPLDLFGAFPYEVASVKPSKKRK